MKLDLNNLEDKKVRELRELAGQLGVTGKNKEELIAAIVASAQVREAAKPRARKGKPEQPDSCAEAVADLASPVEPTQEPQQEPQQEPEPAPKPPPRDCKARKADAAAKVAQGLGSMVWWDLGDAKVRPDALRDILREEGSDIEVPDIDPLQAVKGAAQSWRQGRGKADRYRTEVVHDDGQSVTVGLLKREQVGPGEVAWRQVDAVTYDAQGSERDPGTTAEAASFRELARDRMTYLDHSFVRPEVLQASLAGMHAFTLRRQGGVYYVPARYDDDLQALVRIVTRIGSCELDVVSVAQTEAGRKALAREAEGSLEAQLNDITEKLDAWQESSRRVREDSQASVLAGFVDLRDRAALYADALQVGLDALLDRVGQAEERCREIIGAQPKKEDRTCAQTCPKCGAGPGEYCQNPGGTIWTSGMHRERRMLMLSAVAPAA